MRGDVKHAAGLAEILQFLKMAGGVCGTDPSDADVLKVVEMAAKPDSVQMQNIRLPFAILFIVTLGEFTDDYFLTVKAAENSVASQLIFRMPPPVGSLAIAIVNSSTGVSSVVFFKSIRARSCVSS